MPNEQLFIPSRIKVGFDKREDTYTKKLAYVIYFDQKGKLRKETSWENWRNKSIPPVEHDNTQMEGFVLNKGVGGVRQSYGWNARNEYIRVYDPRDFEFEISVANLLFILRVGDCSRGKGLEGKFVYAWEGKELILLPVASEEYEKSSKYTTMQGKKISVKELIRGATYLTKKMKSLVYLGRLDYFQMGSYNYCGTTKSSFKPEHVYWDVKYKLYTTLSSPSTLCEVANTAVHPDYASLVQQFQDGPSGAKPKRLFLREGGDKDKYGGYRHLFAVEKPNNIFACYMTNGYDSKTQIQQAGQVTIDGDGHIVMTGQHRDTIYRDVVPGYSGWKAPLIPNPNWVEPTNQAMWVELENGHQFQLYYY